MGPSGVAARMSPRSLSSVWTALLLCSRRPASESILWGLFAVHPTIMREYVALCVCLYRVPTGCITLSGYFFSDIKGLGHPSTYKSSSLFSNDGWFSIEQYLMVYFASLLLVGIWVTTINNTSVNILPHAPEGSRTLSKTGKNHWLSHSCWVSITLCSTNLAHSLPLVGIFRLILMIPAHATSTSCFPTGNPVQRPSELRTVLSVLRTEKPPQF